VRVPPTWLRRPLSVGLLAALAFAATLLPLLVVVAVLASAWLPGRWRPLRLLAFLLVYLALETAAVVVAFGLWVASGFGWRLRSPRFVTAHYAVLRLLLHALVRTARRLFALRVVADDAGWSPLDDGRPGSTNAMLVLSRHAGPGDSFLLVETLMDRDHLRRPRIVLKDTLQLDPAVDIYLNRLPNRFLTSGRSDLATQVGELARGLGEEDALLIFPEGGNFTPARRLRAIDRLRGKGLEQQADRAERMHHVLPPRPGGVLEALRAAPHADVVFVAHTGLEHLSTPADLWHGLPMDTTVAMRWDFVPADEVPRDPAEQEDWLYEHWAAIDRWVSHRVGSRPAAPDVG
jgi:1-acyl-sn-glycerol-3-phosphate acyltransferase